MAHDVGDAMPYLDAERYRERECHWRSEACRQPDGAEREACLSIANGYAHLVTLIERIGQEQREPVRPALASSNAPSTGHTSDSQRCTVATPSPTDGGLRWGLAVSLS
jgi:hypothetical protein